MYVLSSRGHVTYSGEAKSVTMTWKFGWTLCPAAVMVRLELIHWKYWPTFAILFLFLLNCLCGLLRVLSLSRFLFRCILAANVCTSLEACFFTLVQVANPVILGGQVVLHGRIGVRRWEKLRFRLIFE